MLFFNCVPANEWIFLSNKGLYPSRDVWYWAHYLISVKYLMKCLLSIYYVVFNYSSNTKSVKQTKKVLSYIFNILSFITPATSYYLLETQGCISVFYNYSPIQKWIIINLAKKYHKKYRKYFLLLARKGSIAKES